MKTVRTWHIPIIAHNNMSRHLNTSKEGRTVKYLEMNLELGSQYIYLGDQQDKSSL